MTVPLERQAFYARLNQILDKHNFDEYVKELCQRFYADEVGRPGLPPGRYFRLLLIWHASVGSGRRKGRTTIGLIRTIPTRRSRR